MQRPRHLQRTRANERLSALCAQARGHAGLRSTCSLPRTFTFEELREALYRGGSRAPDLARRRGKRSVDGDGCETAHGVEAAVEIYIQLRVTSIQLPAASKAARAEAGRESFT